MADAVTTKVLYEDKYQYIVHLNCISDATGESAVKKVDIATIGVAIDNGQPASLDVERIEWNVKSFTSVTLWWDHTTDDLIIPIGGGVINSWGYFNFTGKPHQMSGENPGLIGASGRCGALKDPRSPGGDGSILLTSSATAGGLYSITLWLYKNPD